MTLIQDSVELSLPTDWQSQLPDDLLTSDSGKMKFVVSLAEWNIRNQHGGPFAAAVFDTHSHELVSIGLNRVVPQTCSLAHAEALAIALAQRRFKTHDLSRTATARFELFASGQPCVQCFGMVWWSGLTRLVIGARSTDIEELTQFREGPLPEDWQQILSSRSPLPPVEVITDICREEARAVLKEYAESGGRNYGPGM